MAALHDFTGKVALVTGAATGIGRATALAFAEAGASVVVSDIDVTRGTQVAETIVAQGGKAMFQRCDATSEADIAALVEAALATYGRLDHAHNNTGFGWGQGLIGSSEEDFDKTVNLCLKAPFLCMKHEIPVMQRQGGGSIVNTASMAGESYAPLASAPYSAAKAGVIHLTRYAAMAHAADGIRINSVSPGLVGTEAVAKFLDDQQLIEAAASTQPIGRPIFPEEIAAAVLWLCSGAAAMITGDVIHVAGGKQAQ